MDIGFDVEHPGIILWEEYLQPLGISQSRFARDVHISYPRANELLNGKRALTPDTALRLANHLGGKLQVNDGLLTDDRGCPVSISAFPGNTSDCKTLLPQVERLQGTFNLKSVVLVGDRGMISQKQVDELKGHSGVGTGLRH